MSDNRIIVMRGTGPQWNPIWWTPERCAELLARNPTAHRTDVLSEFAAPETAWIGLAVLQKAQREGPAELEWNPTSWYCTAMDPATRGNGWTLVVNERDVEGKVRVACIREWVGSKETPLDTDATIREVAKTCALYGIFRVLTDQWSVDALRPSARAAGLELAERNHTTAERLQSYENVRVLLESEQLELPPSRQLREDLLRVRKKTTATGIAIELPRTADGRHCDFAPSLVLACTEFEPSWLGSAISREAPATHSPKHPWQIVLNGPAAAFCLARFYAVNWWEIYVPDPSRAANGERPKVSPITGQKIVRPDALPPGQRLDILRIEHIVQFAGGNFWSSQSNIDELVRVAQLTGTHKVYITEDENQEHLRELRKRGLRIIFLDHDAKNEAAERELLNGWFANGQISIERPETGIDAIRSFVATVARAELSEDRTQRFSYVSPRGVAH